MFDKETYKDWVEYVQKQIDEPSCQWNRVGLWGFPTKDNEHYHDMVIHYCHEYWEVWTTDQSLENNRRFDECQHCGEETPDGIKMIALLAKL